METVTIPPSREGFSQWILEFRKGALNLDFVGLVNALQQDGFYKMVNWVGGKAIS